MGGVAQVIADPNFATLSAEEQRGVLAHFDSSFAQVSAAELPAVIQGIRKAIPPGVPKPVPAELTGPASQSEPALGMYGGPTGEVRRNPTFAQIPGDVGTAVAAGAGITGGGLVAGQLASAVPGLAKGAVTWASANPVKAYLLYKIADELGLGPSSIRKFLHLASKTEE